MKVQIEEDFISDMFLWSDSEWNEWNNSLPKKRRMRSCNLNMMKKALRLVEIGRCTNIQFVESYWASVMTSEDWPEVLDEEVIENRKWFSDKHGIIQYDHILETQFSVGHSDLDHKEFYACRKNRVRSFVFIISNYFEHQGDIDIYTHKFEKAGFTKCLALYSKHCMTLMIKASSRSELKKLITSAQKLISE